MSTYLAMTVTFLVVDLLWLGLIARPVYKKYLGSLMRKNVIWLAAIIFYLLFIVGIFIFVVLPAHQKASMSHAIGMGALFGFFTYMTFELTAFATLKNWPLPLVFIDIIWGTVLTSIISLVGFWAMSL